MNRKETIAEWMTNARAEGWESVSLNGLKDLINEQSKTVSQRGKRRMGAEPQRPWELLMHGSLTTISTGGPRETVASMH